MTGPDEDQDQADLDNHANQLNPEHDAYWSSRGESGSTDDQDDDE